MRIHRHGRLTRHLNGDHIVYRIYSKTDAFPPRYFATHRRAINALRRDYSHTVAWIAPVFVYPGQFDRERVSRLRRERVHLEAGSAMDRIFRRMIDELDARIEAANQKGA